MLGTQSCMRHTLKDGVALRSYHTIPVCVCARVTNYRIPTPLDAIYVCLKQTPVDATNMLASRVHTAAVAGKGLRAGLGGVTDYIYTGKNRRCREQGA